jgi:hypothetical protein
VAELHGRRYPQLGESWNVSRRKQLGMLDSRAEPLPIGARRLESVQRLAVREVADGVDGEREPGARPSANELLELLAAPEPSSMRAVCEPSVPSMNAFS